MSEAISTYGKTRSAALVAAGVLWAIAVAMADVGSSPDLLTQGIGYLGLALLAVGMGALLLMLVNIYTPNEA